MSIVCLQVIYVINFGANNMKNGCRSNGRYPKPGQVAGRTQFHDNLFAGDFGTTICHKHRLRRVYLKMTGSRFAKRQNASFGKHVPDCLDNYINRNQLIDSHIWTNYIYSIYTYSIYIQYLYSIYRFSHVYRSQNHLIQQMSRVHPYRWLVGNWGRTTDPDSDMTSLAYTLQEHPPVWFDDFPVKTVCLSSKMWVSSCKMIQNVSFQDSKYIGISLGFQCFSASTSQSCCPVFREPVKSPFSKAFFVIQFAFMYAFMIVYATYRCRIFCRSRRFWKTLSEAPRFWQVFLVWFFEDCFSWLFMTLVFGF